MRYVPVPGTGTSARSRPLPSGAECRWVFSIRSRAHSSAGERPLHTREVPSSIPGAPTFLVGLGSSLFGVPFAGLRCEFVRLWVVRRVLLPLAVLLAAPAVHAQRSFRQYA